MKKPLLKAVAVAAAVALLAGAAYAQQQPSDQPSRPDLTIAQILPHLESQGYTAISSIEKDDGVWKVEATSPRGVRVDVRLDAKDGRLLREEHDDEGGD